MEEKLEEGIFSHKVDCLICHKHVDPKKAKNLQDIDGHATPGFVCNDCIQLLGESLKSECNNSLTEESEEATEEEQVEVTTTETAEAEETFADKIDILIKDEEEAIDGYEEVIDSLEDEHIINELEKIETEEVAHKDFLEKVKDDPTAEYVEPLEQETKETSKEESVTEVSELTEDAEDEHELDIIDDEEQNTLVDPRDIELVNKLTRIAHDTAEAIVDSYGVDVDERLILADLIQDLQLVSGQLKPEDLEDTPLNNLTKEMYAAYNGFYEAMDNLVSFITGRPITTTQAQKLEQALELLDSEQFSTETIKEKIQSPEFLLTLQHGQVPGITYDGDLSEIRLLDNSDNYAIDLDEAFNKEGSTIQNALRSLKEDI